jgi:hypothetical protein
MSTRLADDSPEIALLSELIQQIYEEWGIESMRKPSAEATLKPARKDDAAQ